MSTAPTSIPRIGFENAVKRLANPSSSANGATESLIASIPNIRIANPNKIFPTSFFLLSPFDDIVRIIPTAASIGENDDGLSN